MKCPKCNYIAFDSTTRCRNCGFEFSLARTPSPSGPDLPLRQSQPAAPLDDFDLGPAKRPPHGAQADGAERVPDPAFDPGVPPASTKELPLFGDSFFGEAPLVRPSAPSAPLSVRRSTPVPARTRPSATPRPAEPRPDSGLPLGSPSFTTLGLSSRPGAPVTAVGDWRGAEVASVGVRFGAAALDWVMLFGLDLAVIYFTLRVSRLDAGEITLLPAIPLAAFLLLLNGGYLAMFTVAGGQTLGKMVFHLRVVPSGEGSLTIRRSLLRVVAFLLSALPAGLGLLPAIFDRDHRGLHDRLAGTRVVQSVAP